MNLDINNLNLFCCIINYGKGSKALKLAKKTGAIGGTIFLGDGTVSNELLNILGLLEIRKEIFLAIIDPELEDIFFNEMNNKFGLDKPNHGIAFSMSIKSFVKINKNQYLSGIKDKDVKNVDYEAIFVIVDKGLSDGVIDSAQAAGSKGGTVIHGRGSSSQEKAKLFGIEIEPEKDIVLILSKVTESEKIVNTIKANLNICKPGTGIIFVLDVNKTLGLYES